MSDAVKTRQEVDLRIGKQHTHSINQFAVINNTTRIHSFHLHVFMSITCFRVCLHEIPDETTNKGFSSHFIGSVGQLWTLSIPYTGLRGGEGELQVLYL